MRARYRDPAKDFWSALESDVRLENLTAEWTQDKLDVADKNTAIHAWLIDGVYGYSAPDPCTG